MRIATAIMLAIWISGMTDMGEVEGEAVVSGDEFAGVVGVGAGFGG